MKRRSIAAAVLAAAALAVPALFTGGAAQATTGSGTFYVTAYGWYDNDPAGDGISYGSHAGGVGTYSNPITFATDPNELKPGTIVYISSLRKYFKMQDYCAQCHTDWSHGKKHIDLWIGGKGYESASLNCEDRLTSNKSVTVNPPSNLSVNTTPLFSKGKCIQ